MRRSLWALGALVLLASACAGGGGDKAAKATTAKTNFPPLTSKSTVNVLTSDPTPTLPSTITTVSGATATVTGTATGTNLPTDSGNLYVVQKGDSLASIAGKLQVTKEDLIVLNNITDPNHLEVGQKLKVPTQRPGAATTKAGSVSTKAGTATTKAGTATTKATCTAVDSGNLYTVVSGDTVGSIAIKLGTTTAKIVCLNNLTDPSSIQVGQKLKVPGK